MAGKVYSKTTDGPSETQNGRPAKCTARQEMAHRRHRMAGKVYSKTRDGPSETQNGRQSVQQDKRWPIRDTEWPAKCTARQQMAHRRHRMAGKVYSKTRDGPSETQNGRQSVQQDNRWPIRDTQWPAKGMMFMSVGCSTSQQPVSVSQGRICSDNCTYCHTEIEIADPTFHLNQSQYTDTRPTSPSTDPIMPGAWQGSHWSANV